jgi:hypothetical protein
LRRLLALALVLVTSACGGGDGEGAATQQRASAARPAVAPAEVVVEYADAVVAGDVERARDAISDDTAGIIGLGPGSPADALPFWSERPAPVARDAVVLEQEIERDLAVVAFPTDDASTGAVAVPLVLEDARWRIAVIGGAGGGLAYGQPAIGATTGRQPTVSVEAIEPAGYKVEVWLWIDDRELQTTRKRKAPGGPTVVVTGNDVGELAPGRHVVTAVARAGGGIDAIAWSFTVG